ncbi:Lectin precursor [Aphelenchoides avenae]|nr:Lectin precursor [Aphelenchus avenae]
MTSTQLVQVWGTVGDIFADTWPKAQSDCESLNANLVTIHNAATNDDVLRYARDSHLSFNHFPIGLKYDGKTKAWTWRDGSSMDYTNWAPGYPIHEQNIYGQGTDYAYMWMYGVNASLWINDYKQTYEESLVLCERSPKA